MDTQLLRQKTLYDKKIYGDPFKEGDLEWLHSTVVPKGCSKKLHHPWSGPFTVVKRLVCIGSDIQKVDTSGL